MRLRKAAAIALKGAHRHRIPVVVCLAGGGQVPALWVNVVRDDFVELRASVGADVIVFFNHIEDVRRPDGRSMIARNAGEVFDLAASLGKQPARSELPS